jgi:ATP-dependent Lon protease
MELIEISGYTEEEKLGIAQHHFIKKQLKENGLNRERISFSEKRQSGASSGNIRREAECGRWNVPSPRPAAGPGAI